MTASQGEPNILIIYATLRGNTGKMVEPVLDGVRAAGVAARALPAAEATMADMVAANGIVIGTPTRFGAIDWQLKRLFDEVTIEGYPGPLDGKVGGAFASGSRAGSGVELALLDALHILLNHGLIIQGHPADAHYGPVSLGEPNERVIATCHAWGKRWADLVLRLR